MSANRKPAQSVAYLIAFVAMVGAGISAVLSLTGNVQTGLRVCAGSVLLGLILLLVGGWLVAANRPEE